MLAKKELEEERRQLEDLKIDKKDAPTQDVREFEHSSAITQVYYTCELLGEDVVKPKVELMKDLEQFLGEQVESADEDGDKIIAAVLMLYSLNKQQQRDTAIETICKYVQNILEHPGEEKYRQIRLTNKAFQERVASAIGGRKFLESVGFTEKSEEFLVFDRQSDVHLVEALENLRNGQSVPIKVARNLEIFAMKEGQKLVSPKLADEFFNLSADELKAEQRSREHQVDRMLTLRTKEMRQKDDQLRNYKYKYTLIRIRVPGNMIIQGVFSCYEAFSAVRSFVSSVLSEEIIEFALRDAANQQVDEETLTLAQLGLAPAAVLHLVINGENFETIISDEYVGIVQQLD
ncbi:unnamed protein product [Caenorhabditis angaria]|uniref:PUB domain-containing protein n=1 Tax=Caenorhabditis angaria TaxID=860376 RepID=A0A9P1INK8_9PELO|nr:unnamed protein product [Caenorhabditis angaria]